jgi:hypothetical protein
MMPDALRGEYLEAMGIEVWYCKPVSPRDKEPGAEPADLSAAGTISPFTIGMLQYSECLMVFELDGPVEKLAPEHQSLLDDLALSLGAEPQQGQLFQEDWSRSIEADSSDLIRRRAGQLIGDHKSLVLVLGDVPQRLLLGEQVDAMGGTRFLGRRTVTAMGLDAMINDPISKRSLWLKMQEPESRA